MSWRDFIAGSLEALDTASLRRETRVVPAGFVDFSSNDYLGLSRHPDVVMAAREALSRGMGPRGSALICGYTDDHAALEAELAELEHTESALLFPTGFAANLGVLSALGDENVTLFSDELNHASLIDGCRLARRNGAKLVVYPHADLDALNDALAADSAARRLIVTDSVFSMDGDTAPLAEIVELAERYDAWVMVDEAHATLVFGPNGGGVSEAAGVADRIAIRVGTLSKAFGAQGGFVACGADTRALLLNRARSYIYSTALPVPIVAAARAALRVASTGEHRAVLTARVRQLAQARGTEARGPIVPVIVGSEENALAAAAVLREARLFTPAIRPPTVPVGTSRLRITLSAAHSEREVERLIDCLGVLEVLDHGE